MKNHPTFHLGNDHTDYYEQASYTWSEDSIRFLNTVNPSTQAHYLYVQECGVFKTKPPYYTERSGLPSFLIVYTIRGKGKLTWRKQTMAIEQGSCFYIDCREPHRYENADADTWEFLWLHFNGPGAEHYFEDFHSAEHPVLMPQDTFLVESTLRRILSLARKKTVYTDILTASLITNLVTELMIQSMTDSRQIFVMPDYVNRSIEFLQAHFSEPLTLDTIAAYLNISKYHLSREFTRCTGESIHQYLIRIRVNQAKILLKETTLSVEEIAYQVGIQHASHLIQLFREREGMTPLEFRKHWASVVER